MTTSTAGDVTVHRCVVRVVRRGGWSWGPDPRGLVRQALDALPELLPEALAAALGERFADALAGDGPDLEITEPVTVTVRLRRPPATLTGLVLTPDHSTVNYAANSTVDSTVDTVNSAVDGAVDPGADLLAVVAAPPGPDRRTPAVLFAELAGRGELVPLLASLPGETLRVFLLAVLADLVWSVPPNGDAVLTALAAEFARRQPPGSPPPGSPLTESPLPGPGSPPASPSPADLLALVRAQPAVPPEPPPAVTSPPVAVGETTVCSVLPFLLAGPLARIGYLDAIGPALAAVDLLDDAPLFAAALAYQVLPAPERGWRHTAGAHAAAAAFAGLTELPDLGRFAATVAPALPVLDGVLALSLCRGHDPTDPLLVTGTGDGLLLVDSVGLFPIAWAPDVVGLLGHWAACGRPDLVVCDSPLPPHCLRDLAEAGAAVITTVRPLRGDPLTRLPRPTPPWTTPAPQDPLPRPTPPRPAADSPPRSTSPWTAGDSLPRPTPPRTAGNPLPRSTPLWTAGNPAPRLAADLPAHTAHLDELLAALSPELSVPPGNVENGGPPGGRATEQGGRRSPDPVVGRRAATRALERSAMLAAALGLGLISWNLWRERETPSPVLALARFADLEATVHHTSDAVRVRLPLGRRHADLLRAGALTDVPDVVWLGGRTLTFAGG
ncbi:hypothetical protein BLA60_17210 [Actinophytocola xinjiangensis]|uniref:Uncharacterized protein n=1 Tax=Actinophytocola xinjiangensis TaxID=485602 RepID=A0A7Z0WLG1_9PSEU|nr:hypothetical protein [Actinophytocola xinjiangensis]OLF10182.1 hypothetical protein BLA60_17210 [Actinophytocola xinjiangensis]